MRETLYSEFAAILYYQIVFWTVSIEIEQFFV